MKKNRCKILSMAFVLWFVSRVPSAGHAVDPADELKGFDAYILQQMEEWKVPGCSVAIVRAGRVIFSKGFGTIDIQKSQEVTPMTLFRIGSATKAFTAAAVGMLADEGAIQWDGPIRDLVPSFEMFDPYVTERVSFRDLLCHRTGLARHDLLWYGSSFTRKEIFERLRYLEPCRDLRTTWQYSNILYSTAGYCVELITGRTWEEFVTERIFRPLGMKSSGFSWEDSQAGSELALPYASRGGEVKELPLRDLANIGPAGSILSNLNDMTRWILFNLGKGEWEGRRLLSEANMALIHSPQMVIPAPIQDNELLYSCYGLGWAVNPYRGHLMVHHGGGIDGFASYVCLLPRDDMGLVILTNYEGTPLVQIIGYCACDRLLGEKPVDWCQRFKDLLQRYRDMTSLTRAGAPTDGTPKVGPSRQLEDYTGNYEHPAYGILRVIKGGDFLVARLNDIELPLEPYRYDAFVIGDVKSIVPLTGKKVLFSQDAEGKIAGVAVPLEPQVKDIVFQKIVKINLPGDGLTTRRDAKSVVKNQPGSDTRIQPGDQGKASLPAAPSVDELMAKYYEAMGGLKNLRAWKSMKAAAKYIFAVPGGTEVPITVWYKAPDKTRIEMLVDGRKAVYVVTGEAAWMCDAGRGFPEPTFLPEEQACTVRDNADVYPFIDYKRKGHRVEYLGSGEFEGCKIHKLKLIRNTGAESIHFLDDQTGRELKIINKVWREGKEVLYETVEKDFRYIDWLLLPFTTESLVDQSLVRKMIIEDVELDLDIEDSLFNFPMKNH